MVQIKLFDNKQSAQTSSEYTQAYVAWKDVWAAEYQKIYPDRVLYSDTFTRQDQVLGVFVDGECAAATLFHEVDLSLQTGRDDSYFAPWPIDILEELCRISSKIYVWSALSIPKRFRGTQHDGFALKDILAASSVYHFLNNTQQPLMVGTMRNTKRANDLVFKFGAKFIRTVDCNNEPSDLVVLNRDHLPKLPEDIAQFISRSWGTELALKTG